MANPTTAAHINGTAPDADQMSRFMDWFWTSDEMTRDDREERKKCRRFVDGYQWETKDRDALHAKGKPALTFNRIGPVVDAVIGLEIATRQETAVKPRGVEDAQPSEVFTGLVKWLRDMAKAADAETEAFRDTIIGGIGWTDTQADEQMSPIGMPTVRAKKVRMDPEYVWFDHAASERNLTDGRYVFAAKDVALEHAKALIQPPEGEAWDDHEYDAAWARTSRDLWKGRGTDGWAHEDKATRDKRKGLVTLVEVQWYEYFPGQSDIARREMRANLGGRVLRSAENPVQGRGFSLQAITGKRDVETHGWYGVVRAMLEPQAFANKWMSQYLHIVNTSANGGLVLEKGAVEDLEAFNKDFSRPDMNVEVAEGTIAGNRMMPKPQTNIPAGLRDLLQMAMDAPYTTTGISPEMLGMVQREQAGVLEESRKQAAVGILAWLMESGRQHRQESGTFLMGVIKAMIPPELAVRVLGEQNAEAVMAAYAPGVDEYDIVVDESPQSPNQKERTWVLIQPMLKFIIERGTPEMIVETMRYSPFPSSLISAWEKSVAAAKEDPQQQQQQQAQMEMMQLTMQELQAKIDNLMSQAELNRAKAGQTVTATQLEPMRAQAEVTPDPVAPQAPPEFEPFAMEKAAAEVEESRARAAKLRTDAAIAPVKVAMDQQRAQAQQNARNTDGR